jgi:hypothetical protein
MSDEGSPLNGAVIEPEIVSDWVGSPEGTLDERRQAVMQLRMRRLSQAKIAAALAPAYPGYSQGMVSRDLEWIRKHWRDRYGSPSKVDPAEEVGEAIEMFRETEYQAMKDFHRMKPEESRGRNTCLRTAMLARQMRIALMQDLGFIDRRPVTANLQISLRADQVRRALRDEGLLTDRPVQMDEAGVGPDDADVDQWLARG